MRLRREVPPSGQVEVDLLFELGHLGGGPGPTVTYFPYRLIGRRDAVTQDIEYFRYTLLRRDPSALARAQGSHPVTGRQAREHGEEEALQALARLRGGRPVREDEVIYEARTLPNSVTGHEAGEGVPELRYARSVRLILRRISIVPSLH